LYLKKKEFIEHEMNRLQKDILKPGSNIEQFLRDQQSSPLQCPTSALELIRRPEISYAAYLNWENKKPLSREAVGTRQELENQIKYEGYINKQKLEVEKATRMYEKEIPDDFIYSKAINLSHEARQKLEKFKPKTVGQASRMEGISPADIQVLLLYLGRPDIFNKQGNKP